MQVTTSHNDTPAVRARARRLAHALGVELVRRTAANFEVPTLIVGRDRLTVRTGDDVWAWHPGLLHGRIESSMRHPMIRAGGLVPGDRVLDTTCGLGTDSAFLAYITEQPVVALEAKPLLALLTGVGLKNAGFDVQVIAGRSGDVLASLPEDAFDAVYSDPLFRPGRKRNPSIQAYRELGDPWKPDARWLADARRVARKVVVVKDEVGGDLLEHLGPDEVFTGSRAVTRYGRFSASGVEGR